MAQISHPLAYTSFIIYLGDRPGKYCQNHFSMPEWFYLPVSINQPSCNYVLTLGTMDRD
nr:hypothetical protein [Arthrospira sp. PLM2.Bin9]